MDPDQERPEVQAAVPRDHDLAVQHAPLRQLGAIDGIVKAALTDASWIGYAPEGYVFAGLCFWIFCFAMSRYSLWVEKQLNRSKTR